MVNYEIHQLPGEAQVREVSYPDNNRRYFKQGDNVLLLQYLNDPQQQVYDTIKVIDAQNALGVMHLGDFPHGLEFATFVLARNNYPFEKMSVEDHQLLFADARTSVPSAALLEGQWNGNLIFVEHPNSTLINQLNPVVLQLNFATQGTQFQAAYKFGLIATGAQVELTPAYARVSDLTVFQSEIRMIDHDTLIGKWTVKDLLASFADSLRNFTEPGANQLTFYFILTRVRL